jgi:hypothetical protein
MLAGGGTGDITPRLAAVRPVPQEFRAVAAAGGLHGLVAPVDGACRLLTWPAADLAGC